MPCLLYGVVLSRPEPPAGRTADLPLGVGGVPVSLIDVGRVAAVVAKVARATVLTPTLESVMAYAGVVEALHADRAVLPMRFGCVLEGKADVAHLLCERGSTYIDVLRELEGCVEMGIRMLARHSERGADSLPASAQLDVRAGAARLGSGADYLAERRRAYDDADRRGQEMTELAERIGTAFHGLFVRCNAGTRPAVARSVASAPLFSIDFLVRRESVSSFHQMFQRINRAERTRLLLSGPWPPYNFVEPASLPCFMAPAP